MTIVLTPPVSWSAYSLRKDWNQTKDEVAPWWAENSKEACSSGLANLATALGNWADSRNGKRKGRKLGFPRLRGKRAGLSCRFTTGAFGLTDDRRHVKLPRIGLVRTHESTRKLARHVERGTARIRELRRLQRQATRRVGPDKRTRSQPSARWRKTQARITRLHTQVANTRRDGLHKLSTRLVRAHGAVVVEDLNVAGMIRNRRLARHVAGIGMAELRRQIEYKAQWSGVLVHVADRWFPSSKTCSACGVVKAKLRLSDRVYRCDTCGLVLDRDLNAATGTATGRPAPAGQRRRRKATAA